MVLPYLEKNSKSSARPALDLGLHHGERDVDSYPEEQSKKVLEEILVEGFDGVIVCDGWRPYGSFTDRIQRCWTHLLREAEYLAERHGEAGPLWEALRGLYGGLRCWAVDKPPPEEAERLAGEARAVMEGWAGRSYESVEVRRFAAKDKERHGSLVHLPRCAWGGAYE